MRGDWNNILAAKEKSDVKVEEIDAKGLIMRQVTVEFDSHSIRPWTFETKKSSVMVHPGELVVVEFEVTVSMMKSLDSHPKLCSIESGRLS